jgi:hypothetical protein
MEAISPSELLLDYTASNSRRKYSLYLLFNCECINGVENPLQTKKIFSLCLHCEFHETNFHSNWIISRRDSLRSLCRLHLVYGPRKCQTFCWNCSADPELSCSRALPAWGRAGVGPRVASLTVPHRSHAG